MLTAMAAVENIKNVRDKSAIWEINTEQEYHEDKSDATTTSVKRASGYRRQQIAEVLESVCESYLFTGLQLLLMCSFSQC